MPLSQQILPQVNSAGRSLKSVVQSSWHRPRRYAFYYTPRPALACTLTRILVDPLAAITLNCSHIWVTIVGLNQDRIDGWNSPDYKLTIYGLGLQDVVREARGRDLLPADVGRGTKDQILSLFTLVPLLRRWARRVAGTAFVVDIK